MAHIFISYSSIDKQWVEKFHTALEQELKSRVDPKIEIWRDEKKLHGGDRTDDVILGEARKAKILLAVLSKAWLGSRYCRKELDASTGVRIGIEKVPLDQDDLPAAFASCIRRKFHSEHGSTLQPRSSPFRKAIEAVAKDVEHQLNSALPPTIETEALVAELRALVEPDIREHCGKIRILTMEQPIELGGVYTDVNVLEKITGRQRKYVEELIQSAGAAEVNRLGTGAVQKRVEGTVAIDSHKRLMILGKPGAGKTTFLKRLATECAAGRYHPDLIPAFITLKDFAEAKDEPALPDYIRNKWANHPETDAVLRDGRAMVLLDGLDEVRNEDFGRVRKQIDGFVKSFPECLTALTCRIAAREYVFESFTEVEMADFNAAQLATFANNWFHLRGHPEKARDFLGKLEANAAVRDLASSPLLATLLCLVFEERTDFEGTRAELYREGLEILLRKWDASRNIERDRPYRNLSLGQKESLLAEIAYSRFVKGEYFFDQTSLERQIENFFSARELLEKAEELRPAAVLEAMEAQHGILIERANHVDSFSHLTVQEFLTAQRMTNSHSACAESGAKIGDPRWHEVFRLYATMIDPDRAIRELKRHTDQLVASDEKIQDLLAWASSNGTWGTVGQMRATIQSLFSVLASAIVSAMDSALVQALSGAELLPDLDLAASLGRGLGWAVAIDLGLDRAVDLDLIVDRAWALARVQAREVAREIELLRRLIPTAVPPDAWSARGLKWADDMNQALVRHRNITRDWGFTLAQANMLTSYLYANHLLGDCVKSTRGLTNATLQWVEETMLLPQSKLAKFPPPQA